jgi:hypothetical protein
MYTLMILISTMYMKDVKFQDFTSKATCEAALAKVLPDYKSAYCMLK